MTGRGIMRLVPWGPLHWLSTRLGLCWASVVSLKLYGVRSILDDNLGSPREAWASLKPSAMCFNAHPEPYDYCGHYGAEHPCYKAALRQRVAAETEGA